MAFIPTIRPELRAAYQVEDRDKTIRKTKWGCWLGIVMVPLFVGLDYSFYPEHATEFLKYRLLCSFLMVGIFLGLGTDLGKKYYHFSGILLLFLPSATIAWMVYTTQGATSPYYAGLTLVLMILAVVLDWPFWQSVVSVALVLLLDMAACWFSPAKIKPEEFEPYFIQNLFFLVSSGVAIIAGTAFHSRVRIREFIARMDVKEANEKLEHSRNELAASLQQLEEKQTQLIQSQIQLVQAQKLASFGEISAGIMHEINNALTYPMSGLAHLKKKSKDLAPELEADQTKVLVKIETGLKFVKKIVSGLQDFANPNTNQIESVPVAEVVSQAKLFLSDKWQGTVNVEDTVEDNQTILANKTKMIQVLMILLNNSLDALKAKHFADGEKPAVWIEGRIDNGQSILSVRDNGSGIAEQDRLRIYEPFFTTKGVAGTGLGLSICLGIVREAKGEIVMESAPGKFCKFTLKFPACEANRANN